jgi:hypothetical protein
MAFFAVSLPKYDGRASSPDLADLRHSPGLWAVSFGMTCGPGNHEMVDHGTLILLIVDFSGFWSVKVTE